MLLTGIKLTIDGFVKELEKYEGITYERHDKAKGVNFELKGPEGKPALIRVQETKDGLSLFSDLGQNKEFGKSFLEWFSQQECSKEKVASCSATYDISQDKIDQAKNLIFEVIEKFGYEVNEKDGADCQYRIVAQHPEGIERLTVSQYATGKLRFQGKTWFLWDEICYTIEDFLGCTVRQRVERVMTSPEGNIEDALIEHGEREARTKLGEAYKFLYNEDKDLISSSLVLITSGVKLKDYFSFMSPTARALEGYLKKLIIELKLAKAKDVRHEAFKFNHSIFNIEPGIDNVCLLPSAKKLLTNNIDEIEKELILLYQMLFKYRHNFFHGGPGSNPISNKDHAIGIVDRILNQISESHKKIFS